jgi:hypothetical protein
VASGERVEKYSVRVPAGSPEGTFFYDFDFPVGSITGVQVKIPRGHAGKTSIAVIWGLTPVIPRTADAYLRGNGVSYSVDVDNFPTGEGWTAYCGNTGKRAHTFEVLFSIDETVVSLDSLPPVLLLRQSGEGLGGIGLGTVTAPAPGSGVTSPHPPPE